MHVTSEIPAAAPGDAFEAYSSVPEPLRDVDRWLNYKLSERDGKTTKIPKRPLAPTRNANVADPSSYGCFDAAVHALASGKVTGLGFVFSDEDEIMGVDIDHCRNPLTGEITPEAMETIRTLNTYTEISPSGEGVHCILLATIPGTARRKGAFECYESGRYFTVTGDHLEGTPTTVEPRQAEFSRWYAEFIAPVQVADVPTPSPAAVRTPTLKSDDEDIVRGLRRGKSRAKFEALYDLGDWQSAGDYPSQSEADYALASMLARACVGNAVQVDRIFRQSGLMRPKWDEPHYADGRTYGQGVIESVVESSPTDKTIPSSASVLLEIAESAYFFHNPRGEAFAAIEQAGHTEVHLVEGSAFKHWLRHRFYQRQFYAPSQKTMNDVIPTLVARAMFDGPEEPVFVRVGEANGKAYVDLGDAGWRAVEIDAHGWRVLDRPPVHFTRRGGHGALPDPVPGGNLALLRSLVNVGSDTDFVLLIAWLVGAFSPTGPYPLLILQGEQGSAKSTLAKTVRSLIDPGSPALRSAPREERDLMISAMSGWALVFDNLSEVRPSLSDALCRIATGGGFATRRLYANDEEMLFDATRPVVLNGIADLAVREDLASRAIVLSLPIISEKSRLTEAELRAEFDLLRPALLGALFDAVSAALRHRHEVNLTTRPRMADFATWVVAAESALPWATGEFLAAYQRNRDDIISAALDADLVAAGVMHLVAEHQHWHGSAKELLDEMDLKLGNHQTRQWGWPRTPRGLSDRVRRLAPFLRTVGIAVDFERETTGSRRRLIHLRALGPNDMLAEPSAQEPEANHILEAPELPF